MEPISLDFAARMMHADPIGALDRSVTSICTDTREGVGDSLFFALSGETSDGHEFVGRAEGAGAVAAVVSRPVLCKLPQLVVKDPLRALGQLARAYRDQFSLPVIGITGSVGKTSTKEMLHWVLSARFSTLASEKNFNNEIGVPKTLFRLERTHKIAVVEMGMRGLGQIKELCDMAAPQFGLVTNIGLSHIELVGSREGIANAKGELLASLPSGGIAFLNIDDPYFSVLRSRFDGKCVTFGTAREADFRITDLGFRPDGSPTFRINQTAFSTRALGSHHALNAAAAAAVVSALGIPLDFVAERVAEFSAPDKRLQAIEAAQDILILDDTYNAAPDSMRSAIETLAVVAACQDRRSVAILGDMRELGSFSREGHEYVGRAASEKGISLLITVGAEAEEIARVAASGGIENVIRYESTEQCLGGVHDWIEAGDCVLVKGSRAMAMDRIVSILLS